MSVSSVIATDISEQYYAENPEDLDAIINQEPKKTEREILIDQLKSREKVLSYSSIKHLSSPVNFLNYYLEPKKPQTESQKKGSVIDCLVLTPELFDKTYSIVENTPTTELQVNFCKAVAESKDELEVAFDSLYFNFYKKGNPEPLKHLNAYIIALKNGKDIISKDLFNICEAISNNLKNQEDVLAELEIVEEVQKKIEFEFKGWNFKGILDTYSPKIFHDLKFASDCSPDKFEYDMRKFGYDIQFGLYSLGLMILGKTMVPKFKFIVYDEKFNYSIIEVDEGYLDYARRKVEFLVNCLDKMIDENAFSKSYNFFQSKTKFYKPAWIKGFDNEIFNV
ncbi:hypothetical protein ETU10_08405 [Apibacter muscae]|uniref:PD-(D/E)XK nuclease-like domain-containing protein n=1 Tax=Apibacter muscae TaxID=2509004 RepID=UPI0011AD44BB|nr:PD-(D/E)XK nuclease-like domain-containing protein [Apibacter muscae]TWP23107.1 hypothetical protein ETU10_08405 [Apibacter muscae]